MKVLANPSFFLVSSELYLGQQRAALRHLEPDVREEFPGDLQEGLRKRRRVPE